MTPVRKAPGALQQRVRVQGAPGDQQVPPLPLDRSRPPRHHPPARKAPGRLLSGPVTAGCSPTFSSPVATLKTSSTTQPTARRAAPDECTSFHMVSLSTCGDKGPAIRGRISRHPCPPLLRGPCSWGLAKPVGPQHRAAHLFFTNYTTHPAHIRAYFFLKI